MPQENEVKKIVKIPPLLTVKQFSEILSLPVSEVIQELIKNGIMATINEEIDFETASIIAEDLGFKAEENLEIREDEILTLEKVLEICKKEKKQKKLPHRSPIVTILGHVDHGKTTLLDTIRKTSIATGEAGGITQRISAYQVKKNGKVITFVDTPGHEAFSAMRERGVSIADIAILVVAADDGVRPQTKEVIEYLKEKKIPTVVAINKIDKTEANAPKVKQELADYGILIEEWSGDVVANEISAKNNIGIDQLLESILLVAEVEDLRGDTDRDALAIVLDAHLDSQRGPVATVLVKTGTLKIGQDIATRSTWGRVRRIEDFNGKIKKSAGPSLPVTVIGLNGIPETNEIVQVIDKKLATRLRSRIESESIIGKKESLEKKIHHAIDNEKIKKLPIILKADVRGSIEAIRQILSTIKSDEVAIEYIRVGVGAITESDVKIAIGSGAVIFGFNTHSTTVAKRMAEENKIEVKTSEIIYELVEKIKNKLTELLPPEIIRIDLGKLKVLAIFKTGKGDMIVGGKVIQGKISKGSMIEVERNKEIIGEGILSNLQQNKENVAEVKQGNECGITFSGKTKIAEGDVLLFYTEEEKKRKL